MGNAFGYILPNTLAGNIIGEGIGMEISVIYTYCTNLPPQTSSPFQSNLLPENYSIGVGGAFGIVAHHMVQ